MVNDGMIKMICLFPADEVYKVITAMGKAAEKNDLESFKWCTERMAWFWDVADYTSSDLSDRQQELLIENSYRANTKPAPELIAGIVAPDKEEGPTIAEALRGLNTVREYLEDSMAKKGFAGVAEIIEKLRGKIAAIDGQGAA
jgi:hypothetical protein